MQQLKAFVTGGSGFIGSEVIRQLNARGIQVRALLRTTSSTRNLEGCQYDKVLGDLNDIEALKKGVEGVDYVFHIAGVISAKSREEYMEGNATGSANIARAVVEVNPSMKRFVLVSSVAASGPSESMTPRTETDLEKPISLYGESKLAGEREVFKVADGKFPVTCIRPPAVYGPRDRGIFEFFKFVNAGIAPIFPSNNSTGEKHYSLIHVEDLVNAIVAGGLVEDQGRREVFYVCGDGIHSWRTIMAEIAKGLGKNPWKIRLPGFMLTALAGFYTLLGHMTGKEFPLTLDKLNELRPDFWICSNQMAKKKLGFKPQYDLHRGITSTAKWYREAKWLK